MIENNSSIITAIFVGASAGYLGSLMVLQKMALVGDALSHVALPGLAIALLLGINPFIGAFFFLFLSIVGVWELEKRTTLSMETLVGVFFTACLAIGILITPEPELLEALFGDISKITFTDMMVAVSLSVLVIIFTRMISKEYLLNIISKDLAKVSGVNVSKINFIFLFLVATIVALGIKIVGALLMGALVIIPSASAKNLSTKFGTFSFLSLIFGALSAFSGILIAQIYNFPPGPIIILSGAVIFIVSLIFRRT